MSIKRSGIDIEENILYNREVNKVLLIRGYYFIREYILKIEFMAIKWIDSSQSIIFAKAAQLRERKRKHKLQRNGVSCYL